MLVLYIGLTVGTLGKIVLGVAVLRVHEYILKEHKIDGVVFSAIKRERYITAAAVALIVIGYALEMYFYGTTSVVEGMLIL